MSDTTSLYGIDGNGKMLFSAELVTLVSTGQESWISSGDTLPGVLTHQSTLALLEFWTHELGKRLYQVSTATKHTYPDRYKSSQLAAWLIGELGMH